MNGIRLLILFGTQTGNAKDVAERIGREAKRRGQACKLMAMDAVEMDSLAAQQRVLFVASTTGQGEVPGNMKQFWQSIMRKSLSQKFLDGLRYAIFGLGDSGYIDYNVVAKKLDRRLANLGAVQLIGRGLGDDQHPLGYEASLDPWLAALWAILRLEPTASEAVLDSPQYKVTVMPPGPEGPALFSIRHQQIAAVQAAYDFSCLEAAASGTIAKDNPEGRPWSRIFSRDYGDTRHIEFELGEAGPTYDAGDIISIVPHQDDAAVHKLLKMMGHSPNCRVQIELYEAKDNQTCQMEVMLEDFLRGVLDVNSASPRRYFFEVLQHFAKDELQRERLQHFSTAEGRGDLNLYNQSEGRTVLEVLQDFSSAHLPMEWLVQLCPRLQPRQFSIASSQNAHPQHAHITLAVVDYRTPYKRRKQGLCSTWLSRLKTGSTVPVWTQRGVLHLPEDPCKSIIMIGPGTGIAPFRAFLEERTFQHENGGHVGSSYLYFGCRSRVQDYYYKDLWEQLLQKGILSPDNGLHVAFSREHGRKVYVQEILARNSAQLYNLICEGAHVYVSGSAAKMPEEVANTFKEKVLQVEGGLTQAEAARAMRLLETNKRYTVEAWS